MGTIYTREQASQFLARIDIPAKYRLENNPKLDYPFLRAIHIHMITAVPYENLKIHYSTDRVVNIDPQSIFQKIVLAGRGRGGYCMENSLLLLHMLRAIGFRVYPVGVRVSTRENGVPTGNYLGWVHIVNIVTLEDGSRWTLDVGFGGDGATAPIELKDGATILNMGTQEARLVRDFMSAQTELDPSRKMWFYQCRNGPDKPWLTFFTFSDQVEWLQADYEVSNWYTGCSPDSFQTTMMLAIRFLRRPRDGGSGEDDQEVYGKRMLVNEVIKENLRGRTQVVQECRSEEERIKALRELFLIELQEEEQQAIKGYSSEIKA
ncbi:hypothetical protein V2G26_006050 [Clonostachys chloroleuca]